MSLGVSRVITGLLTVATVVFALSLVRDARGAEVAPSSSTYSQVELALEKTTPTPVVTQVASQATAVATDIGVAPLNKSASKRVVPSHVIATPVSDAKPSVAPTVFLTPTPSPLATATPESVGVAYSISGGGVSLEWKIDTQGESVGMLTKRIMADRGISFVYEASDMGWFVTEIAGVKQDPRSGYYWLFYVNGVLANRSADQVLIKAGDTLTWRYEKTN